MVGRKPEAQSQLQSVTAYIQAGTTNQGSTVMSSTKIIAIVLIVAGVLGLAYGKFSYTAETHEAKIGSLELSVNEKQMVSIPTWAGVAALVAGGLMLLVPKQS